jgi:secretion/DNA translocation related TadE-like protein
MRRGSATLMATALMGLIAAVAMGVSLVVTAVGETRRLQHVADLVALSAADVDQGVAPGTPCDMARMLVVRMDAGGVHCTVSSGRAEVSVTRNWRGVEITRWASARPFIPVP